MTRQASASFAQFFPAAPRAARDRATERERAKAKTQDTTGGSFGGQKSSSTSLANGTSGSTTSGADGMPSETSQQPADGHESPLGDTLNAVGSASSYASTGSSVFSTAARQVIPNGISHIPTSSGTPLTSIESPSHSGSAGLPKPNMLQAHHTDEDEASASRNSPISRLNSSLPEPSPPIQRTPARDPARSRKGLKCTYDPFNDRTLSKHGKKDAKPIYKEFGLEDDDPPPDPRLSKGGRLGYINTDFHLPKSRLRQSPYNLRPYSYDPKTSIGPGPPTQIVVTGFNPLITFSKVAAAFASFGDIAESSNKMHPETGSYLGFATFRYKDAHPSRSRPTPVKAIDAARRAVKAMHGQRIEANQIRVEYDPEGKKSRRMLEDVLKKDRTIQDASTTTTKAPPTGPRVVQPEKAPGPPPMAPKGPSSHRQAVAGVPAWVPSQPKMHIAVEEKSIAKQLTNDPYVFVAHEHVPVMVTTIPHMKKRLKAFAFEDIRIDRTGYFIVFTNSYHGRNEAMKCYRAANHTDLFTYNMVMQLSLPPTTSRRDSESAAAPVQRRRTPSPERKRRTDLRLREDKDRRRREEEADIEEEKRQRAKNFDPVQEACVVVTRELAEHLIKHIRTRVAAPALTSYLDPANHVAKRRKLNLEDPAGSVPSVTVNAGDESPGVSTPNSGADPIERRTGRLEISALPRIRKAKITAQGARNHGFTDPFSRKRASQGRNAFRSLHHRLKSYDSDAESDDEVDVRESVARDTEEPDSRPRSRMSTDDDISKDDFASWGPAEEDSMTEASFAVGESLTSTKKRKLDLEIQSAMKRQKKSDEELFGVTLDNIQSDPPVHEISGDATPDADPADAHSETRSETPAPSTAKGLAKKQKAKKKSKKQIFEEREALKKMQTQTPAGTEEQEPTPTKHLPEDVEPVTIKKETELVPEPVKADPMLFSTSVTSALDLSDEFKLDISALQGLSLSATDSPDTDKLKKKFAGADLGDPLLWLWRRNRVRELNSMTGSVDQAVGIEGYYVPNPTGSARTEGVKKILNAEKSKYLPHHIKVQKAREARQARYKKDGKDVAVEASRLAAEKVVAKGNSRANRANNRRHVTALQDEKKISGDSDAFKFNQLKKRKKPVKFARSAIHNWGLYTEENINKDDMIIEYVGEQVRQSISEIREKRYLKSGMGSSYLFRIDDNTVIDATKKGGIARFINHSCMPNCTAKIIKVDGSKRIVIYALRDIAQHEELTYDYKFEREIGSLDRIPCLCGTAACKGFLN
ncbi:Histone-lysine N-methyltransferase, H3 lysine-4 specific [Colletotrichum chlorophyti]|uniref:Histone-lysine N-methyltransferase, H3 lysine-4 specific n=1 Tax=Colletotrichum chlorophyti TaxID=708187 RepID=A0A1Q8RJH9_9PEZI|nr:Histone-lysine N-methyltransferase, H3 lysine-4 specific [Colletotrichum chlorophyti]